ncbi:hypothetical protein Leryth_002026, partial [Lithospermum erythrorhizon]
MAETKAYMAVLVINTIYTGMFLLTKAALDVGMNSIFVFYRQAFATIFLAPIAFILERYIYILLLINLSDIIAIILYMNNAGNCPTFLIHCLHQNFLSWLSWVTGTLNIDGAGLSYTSASLVAAAANSLPSLVCRMEKLDVRSSSSQWKLLLGVVLCLAGVLTIAFYKGPSWTISSHNIFNHNRQQVHHKQVTHHSNSKTWIIGVFITLLYDVGPILKSYPSKLLFTTSTCLFSAIQSFLVAILVEPDLSEWKLGWNVRLLSAVYC